MTTLEEMTRNLSVKYFNKIKKFTSPLINHFGISQFFYYQLTNDGYCIYLGLRPDWEEHIISEKLYLSDPFLRHPKYYPQGISLTYHMKDEKWEKFQQIASEKYNIHYSMNLRNDISTGVEGFCFGISTPNPFHHALLINELSLIKLFIKRFKEVFCVDNSVLDGKYVNIASLMGPLFNKSINTGITSSFNRQQVLSEMGVETCYGITPREEEVIKFILKGFSASQIGKELFISYRTVEHHLEHIKEKFCCSSKSDLIQKIHLLESLGGLTS